VKFKDSFERILKISAGDSHCLIMTENLLKERKVWSCGKDQLHRDGEVYDQV